MDRPTPSPDADAWSPRDWIARAARNNAAWCDAVARAAGQACSFSETLWINRGEAPPYHPHAVTLTDCAGEAELRPLAEATPTRSVAVKDSFRALDLRPLGFAPLFDAHWIGRAAEVGAADAMPDGWTRVRDAAALADWVRVWGGDAGTGTDAFGAAIFRPALLDEPGHALLGWRRDGRLRAGVVASLSDGVLGLSNLFGPAAGDAGWRAGAVAAASAWAPGLPLVGYESGAELAAMEALRFRRLGPLRIWRREAAA